MPAEFGNHSHKKMECFSKKKMTGGSEYLFRAYVVNSAAAEGLLQRAQSSRQNRVGQRRYPTVERTSRAFFTPNKEFEKPRVANINRIIWLRFEP
jgi:hypothetical protein